MASEEKIRCMSESRKGLEYQSMECLCNQFLIRGISVPFHRRPIDSVCLKINFLLSIGFPFFSYNQVCFLEKNL